MNALDTLYGVSREDWITYEQLRRSGVTNMFGSRKTLGLSREKFAAIMEHYEEMRAAWDADVPTSNPFSRGRSSERLD